MRKYMKMSAKPFQKDESAFPVGCTRGQAPELVLGYEAQDPGDARRSMFERQQLDAQVFSLKTTPLTLDNFVCSDECFVRQDATMNAQNDRVWCRRSLSKPDATTRTRASRSQVASKILAW